MKKGEESVYEVAGGRYDPAKATVSDLIEPRLKISPSIVLGAFES